jgi:hypothetical protein
MNVEKILEDNGMAAAKRIFSSSRDASGPRSQLESILPPAHLIPTCSGSNLSHSGLSLPRWIAPNCAKLRQKEFPLTGASCPRWK